MTVVEYRALYAEQEGRCACCGTSHEDVTHKTFRHLVVDHDHASGAVRGLLCATCNIGLGQFQDNPDLLEAAARYLRSPQ
jgi:hypothetical protein